MRVGLPFLSFIGPGMPPIREQKFFLRLAALEPGFSFDGFVVTAICSLEPGFSLRYEATPFLFKPPLGFLPSLRCHAAVLATLGSLCSGIVNKVGVGSSSLRSPCFGRTPLGRGQWFGLLVWVLFIPKWFCLTARHFYSLNLCP